MANVRIKDLTATASAAASDDYAVIDGVTEGTRKIAPADLLDGQRVETLDAGTLTADQLSIDATLAADDTFSGICITGKNGGETIAQWETVYYSAADAEWMKADADAAGKFPARGMATAATTNGAAANILVNGTVRHDAWNWTVGADIYLSTTAGGLTQTTPSTAGDCVQPVGYAITADIAFFNFGQAYAEV